MYLECDAYLQQLDAILEYVKRLSVANDEDDELEDEAEVDMYRFYVRSPNTHSHSHQA